MINPVLKGYLFAFAASVALAASFVFSKSALNSIDMVLFGFTWFGAGAILNIFYTLVRKRKVLKIITKGESLRLSIIIAVLEGLGTVSFYFAIQQMENPAVVSFIGNLGPVLVTIMGISLLKEKYNFWQLTGIMLTLGGVFIISFYPGSSLKLIIQPGSQYVLLASVFFAVATILARRKKNILEPEIMSTIRSVLLFLVFSVILIFSDREIKISPGVWADVLVGSFLETLLTIIFAYQALRYIEAAKTSLVISTKAVWVLIGAFVFLNTFPGTLELIGGFLTLAGIALISLKKAQRS